MTTKSQSQFGVAVTGGGREGGTPGPAGIDFTDGGAGRGLGDGGIVPGTNGGVSAFVDVGVVAGPEAIYFTTPSTCS